MALVLTPVIYFVEKRIEKYVGHDIAKKMKNNDYQFKNIYENIESFQLFEEYKTFDEYILILTSSSKE